MSSQVEKIYAYARSKVNSTEFNGYCARFVRKCYEAAGLSGSAATATEAYQKYCISKDRSNIPVGAAVFFKGTDAKIGHVAIYAGNRYLFNPAEKVKYQKMAAVPSFRGWGWYGGKKPTGTEDVNAEMLTTQQVERLNKKAEKSKNGGSKTEKKDITKTVIKSVDGYDGKKRQYINTKGIKGEYIELYIAAVGAGNKVYKPIVLGGVSLTSYRTGKPSKLKFIVVKDEKISFQEGSAVIFKVGGTGVFYGYVFSKKRTKQQHIEVTAYDQLRYLTNSETYMYKNKRADEVVAMIAEDFKLNIGTLTNTGYKIESRIEDNKPLIDIINSAMDLTFKNTGARYILYDDFGKLTLKNTNELKLDLMIDETSAQDFDYETSIENTYTQVQIYKDNSETGQREKYIAKNSEGITLYGVLQKTEECDEDENPMIKAKEMLENNKDKTRKLRIKQAFGDINVRGGSQITVCMNLGDIVQNAMMMAEEVTHIFEDNKHSMDITLIRQGQFIS